MNDKFEKFEKLAFLPIDIPYEKLDLEELEVFHDRNYLWPPDVVSGNYGNKPIKDHPTTTDIEIFPHKFWRIVPLLGQLDPKEFTDPGAVRRSWLNRLKQKRKVNIHPNLPECLYGLIKLINQLPIQCNHAEIVRQRKNVPLHNDASRGANEGEESLLPFEPSGYRLLINDIRKDSFYFTPTYKPEDRNTKHYIDIPMTTNTFVINELDMPHGADKIDEQKWIVTTTGIIDSEKHLEMLERSYEKYKNCAIFYNHYEIKK